MSNMECPRCEVHDSPQAICQLQGVGYYDAHKGETLARRLRRKPRHIKPRELRRFVSAKSVFMPHVPHVNTRKYGIVGTYLEDGKETHFILDGCHRAFMCSQIGRPFRVYVLTLEETNGLFLGRRAPKGMRFER